MIQTHLRSKTMVMKTYDEESSVYYSKRFLSEGGRHIDDIEKRLLAKHCEGSALLEIGTATGRFVGFSHQMGWDYTGLDISAQMLLLSRNNGTKLVQGDGEELPIKSSTFDTVVCLHTFHFIPHPMRCVMESIRVLKERGLLILIFETDNWIRRLTLKTGIFQSDQYYFKIQEVIQMMRESGLQIVADGPVLKFPMEIYRKLPLTRLLASLDSSRHWPGIFATLGFVIGRKLEDSETHS